MPTIPQSGIDYIRRKKSRIMMCSTNPPPATFGYTEYKNEVFASPSLFTECGGVSISSNSLNIHPRAYTHLTDLIQGQGPTAHASHRFTSVGRSYFVATDYASIYAFPAVASTPVAKTIAVISLGGGLFGTYNRTTGVLTTGDVQQYWTTYCNMTSIPKVVIYPILGAKQNPSGDLGSTYENTIDVETIGACYPTSALTIVLIRAPLTNAGFYSAFQSAINGFTIGRTRYQPTIISCSWGAPEKSTWFRGKYTIASYNMLFNTAVARGISICAASGDEGSSDGLVGNNVDFPASATNVISCGGTNIVCPNRVYDGRTVETAWSGGGGGISIFFPMSTAQSSVKSSQAILRTAGTRRAVPDIAMIADPNTPVAYIINGSLYTFGGTSLVAPAMAALIACKNTSTNIATLLYSQLGSGFNDITRGSNGGYTTGTGYDLCTGLGSPIG